MAKFEYDIIETLIAWMDDPTGGEIVFHPEFGSIPSEMLDCLKELRDPEVRDDLIRVRSLIPKLILDKSQLESEWGKLRTDDLALKLNADKLLLNYLEEPIGIESNPLGIFDNISALLDYLIGLEFDD